MCMSGGPRRTSHTRTQRVSSKPHLVTGTVTVTFTHEPMRTVLPTTKKIHHDVRATFSADFCASVELMECHLASTLSRASGTGSRRPSRRESQSSQRSQHPGPGPASRIEEQGQTPPGMSTLSCQNALR